MFDFSQQARTLDEARGSFRLPDRRDFNFAFDVDDARAAIAGPPALLGVAPGARMRES